MAINNALQGTGVSIDKVHYSWRYIHCFNTITELFVVIILVTELIQAQVKLQTILIGTN